MTEFRACVLIPTYDNAPTIARVVERVSAHLTPVLVVDDASGPEAAQVMDRLAAEGRIRLRRRARNGGKGAAVKTGLAFAAELGFTHAFQIDGDGQHDIDRMPAFLEAARANPTAVILGEPRYTSEAPKSRLIGRKITQFWANIETGGRVIADPMVGFRIYPVQAALDTRTPGNRMEFDIEIAVRLAWAGVPVINLPVGVRYLTEAEGGVSHFGLWRDNLRISWAHTRLTTLSIVKRVLGWFGVGHGLRKRLPEG